MNSNASINYRIYINYRKHLHKALSEFSCKVLSKLSHLEAFAFHLALLVYLFKSSLVFRFPLIEKVKVKVKDSKLDNFDGTLQEMTLRGFMVDSYV